MNKKIKILIVGYLPPPYGGLETITETVINSDYLKRQFDLLFLRLKTRKESKDRGKFSLLNIHYTLENLFRYLWKIIIYKPQIVYSSMAQNKAGFLRDSLFIVMGKTLNNKINIHFYGGAFDLFYKSQGYFLKLYIRFILKKIDKLIVLGNLIKEQFKKLVEEQKIRVIYNCINTHLFLLNNRHRKETNTFPIKVLFIGYLSRAKGATDLVKASSLIIKDYNKQLLKFCLIGPVIDKEYNITFISKPNGGYAEIKDLIRKDNLSEYIQIYTNVTQDFKIASFYNSDIFVFPSYSEGFPIVVLEAMAAGLPVIVSKVGGLPEVLEEGKNCFFIIPGDYRDLAKKLLILIENPKLRLEMGKQNQLLVKNEFNTQRFAEELSSVWKHLT